MPVTIQDRVETARAGTNPTVVCRVPSGWVVLCDTQFLYGYSVLLPDPLVASLNDLSPEKRAEYLCDMALVGDALIEVTGAYRINYAILGNSEPVLHAHIIPRFMNEPEEYRKNVPWSHPDSVKASMLFDYERHKPLIEQLKKAILNRLSS
jgi:diadenosine tetraphosphate (Ap4A) HIT family hydrolase